MAASNGGSSVQPKISTGKIIETLIELSERIKEEVEKEKTTSDVVKESKLKDLHTDLEKVSKELEFMIGAFDKLEDFEESLIQPLEILKGNVDAIVKDLKSPTARARASSLQHIQHNLKVLRGNLAKVKVHIPLQHQSSHSISDSSRYLQATVASRGAGDLPSLYQAAATYSAASNFLQEFTVKYKELDDYKRLCLLCFAIFPEKAEVRKSLLRFWWVGERLTEQARPQQLEAAGIGKQMDGVVDDILGEFIGKGFIEPVNKRSRLRATSYKMHPIVRSLLISLAKEACFFHFDKKGNPTMNYLKSKKTCLVKSEVPSPWFSTKASIPADATPDESNMKNDKQTDDINVDAKKQQQEKEKEKKEKEEEKVRLKHLGELQTLFNISKQFPELPEERISNMRSIAVLYLGRWEKMGDRHVEVESTDFLLKGWPNMKKLRFFSLQGIFGISALPKSIGTLSNLRMLDLRACHNLEGLPADIGSLKKLAYLDISECYLIDFMPRELGSLSELQVFKGFVISRSKTKGSCTLMHLKDLNKLKKLTINVNSYKFSVDEAGDDLSKFAALEKLSIAWGAVVEGSSPESVPTEKNKMKGSEPKPKPVATAPGKGNGNHQSSSKVTHKAKPSVLFQKLKMPWGTQAASSSKSVPKNNEVAAAGDEGHDHVKKESKVKNQLDDSKKMQQQQATKQLSEKKEQQRREEGVMKELRKLDLQCFPRSEPPKWLVPEKLTKLEKLYMRGGKLGFLPQISEGKKKWTVQTLRLKYLTQVQINWNDLQTQFPHLNYLEKVNCPGITYCPCDADGVWKKLN